MDQNAHTLFGYTLTQFVLIPVVGLGVTKLGGFAFGMAVILALVIVIGLKNRRPSRAEVTWEITEHGTRELWNDGPTRPVKGGVLIDRE